MVEFGLPLVIAIVSGLSAVTTRLHNRIYELDRRLDSVELRIAEKYLSKEELAAHFELALSSDDAVTGFGMD